jgi:hypothetical protein
VAGARPEPPLCSKEAASILAQAAAAVACGNGGGGLIQIGLDREGRFPFFGGRVLLKKTSLKMSIVNFMPHHQIRPPHVIIVVKMFK